MAEQHRIVYRGREFHFVSYDGLPANPKRAQIATAPAWWLMSAGTRWEVMPFRPGQAPAELESAFTGWLDVNVFAAPRRHAG